MTSWPVVAPAAPARLASYPPGSRFGPRVAVDYEFVWILRGSAVWRTQHSTIELRPGRLSLVCPGDTDSYHWDPSTETVHGYLHFSVAHHGALPPVADWPRTRDTGHLPVLEGLCRYLIDLADQPGLAAEERSAHLLASLLDVFVAGPPAPEEAMPPIVDAFLAVAQRRGSSDLPAAAIADLAAATGVSQGHLFRVFRSSYGVGPARALEAVRLARAATLLQRSNATLAEVAHRCGFANPYHFSRRFAAWYGRPPGKYRALSDRPDPYEPLRAAGLLAIARRLTD